ncbi:MAG: prepilin-type N-terminal cleavage/methylation domain-containing protein [Elusimicrobiaceae bacterium]|nr:prepilin-type N-terminal cleavage/methylation domain-containing protein [Elusimicrobiaceae bacterium]
MNKKAKESRAGFTLIELLVVVLIIGILTAIALPQYQKAVEKARAAEAVTLVRAMGNAATAYHIANGEYTDDVESLGMDIPGEITTNYNYATNAVKTKNFICRAASTSAGAFSKAIVYCNRSPYSQFYGIGQLEDGKFFCYGYSSFGTKICKGFGTVKVDVGAGNIGYAFN